MSDSDSDLEGDNCDQQLDFVKELKNFRILFDKRRTPALKSQKEEALNSLAVAYNRKTKQNLDAKRVLKKFNNMKTKVKRVSDVKITGNKTINMSPWQQIFYDLWNAGENPTLQRVPGAGTAGVAQNDSQVVVEPPTKKRHTLNTEVNHDANSLMTLQELQRKCLLKQIETAEVQKSAAIALEQAAKAVEQCVETWFRENSSH